MPLGECDEAGSGAGEVEEGRRGRRGEEAQEPRGEKKIFTATMITNITFSPTQQDDAIITFPAGGAKNTNECTNTAAVLLI